MTPENFKQAWEPSDEKLVTFPFEEVATLKIPKEQQSFLIKIGLPQSAAPFLNFGGKHCIGFPSADQIWKAGAAFQRYRIIGSNGFGDPICLDEELDGTVVYLNHDNEMKPNFMNSTVECLALSLLAFRAVVRETRLINGPEAYLKGQIPNEVVNQFIAKMDEIDLPAIKSDCFWFRSVLGEGT